MKEAIVTEVRTIVCEYVAELKDVAKFGMVVPTATIVKEVADRGHTSTSPEQLRDYVAHVLREAYHVCRYSEDGYRTIHTDMLCSPRCKTYAKRTQRHRVPTKTCPSCFMRIPANTECGVCT